MWEFRASLREMQFMVAGVVLASGCMLSQEPTQIAAPFLAFGVLGFVVLSYARICVDD